MDTGYIFQEYFSLPRFKRYLNACGGNSGKAVYLYRSNLRLSQKMFTVLSLFEIVLRNQIDKYYTQIFGADWLFTQVQPGGFFWQKGCDTSRENLLKTISRLTGRFSNDKTVAALNFGFWRYLFNSKEYAAGGSTLLKVFPDRSKSTSHSKIFNDLSRINFIRNRIAHHEAICFQGTGSYVPSSTYAKDIYWLIIEFFRWLNVPTDVLLNEVDFVVQEFHIIDNL